MINIRLSVAGIFAGVKKPGRDERITQAVAMCARQALYEWVTRRQSPGLLDRFSPSAFARLGLTHRSKSYEARQTKYLGAATPYVSPRNVDFKRLALAILSGKAETIARAAQKTFTPHMRDLVTRPGVGFNLTTSGKTTVRTRLTFPGARILNRGGKDPGQMALYRKQFADLDLGGGVDRKWIMARFAALLHEFLWQPITNAPRQQVTA